MYWLTHLSGFVYLSHFQAPAFQSEALALHCPAGSTSPGTKTDADPAGAAQRSPVMRKRTKRRKPGIWAPLSVPGGSPEPFPQTWSAGLWTAPPPAASASCLARRSTRTPRSCGAARRGLGSAQAAGAVCRFWTGPCFLDRNLSHCPRPCCWRSCCCRARPGTEPAGAPGPGLPPRCLDPLPGRSAGAVGAPPPLQMS